MAAEAHLALTMSACVKAAGRVINLFGDGIFEGYDRQAEAIARAKTGTDTAPQGVNAGTREGAC